MYVFGASLEMSDISPEILTVFSGTKSTDRVCHISDLISDISIVMDHFVRQNYALQSPLTSQVTYSPTSHIYANSQRIYRHPKFGPLASIQTNEFISQASAKFHQE